MENACKYPDVHQTMESLLSYKGSASIILGVVLFSIFIGGFFFFYVTKVEKEIVKEEVISLVNDYIGDGTVFQLVSPKFKDQLTTLVKNLPKPSYEKVDEEVDKHNEELQKQAIKFLGGLAVVGLIIVCVLLYLDTQKSGKKLSENFWDILKPNLILLLAIGFTEFMFTAYIARSFISLDPNAVKKHMISEIKNF